jgi:hypothetical protein
MLTRERPAANSSHIRIETSSGAALTLIMGLQMYANDTFTAAEDVTTSDRKTFASGEASAVSGVSRFSSRGMFHPQPLQGDIMVDGVLASTYIRAVAPAVAHELAAPQHALFRDGAATDPSFAQLEGSVRLLQ